MGWPDLKEKISDQTQSLFENIFNFLLQFQFIDQQQIYLESKSSFFLHFFFYRFFYFLILEGIEGIRSWWVFELIHLKLKKRFEYHFVEERETNKIEKPERMYNDVIENLNRYRDFFEGRIQKILNENEFPFHKINAFQQFLTQYLYLINQKIKLDLPLLILNENLFLNYLNESIHFFSDLLFLFPFLSSSHSSLSPLYLFTQDPTLSKLWINAEINCKKFFFF